MPTLKTTQSLCPVCYQPVPAIVEQVGNRIDIEKRCPVHGRFAATISSDARHYHVSMGAVGEIGGAQPRSADLPIMGDAETSTCASGECSSGCGLFDEVSTCIALIEIVHSCNMECPTCFADAPRQQAVDALPLTEVQYRLQKVIDRKGEIEILQLSGGEPTLHPDFFRLLEWCLEHPKIGYVMINTNGIRLTDSAFAHRLADLRGRYAGVEIYLQYDGLQAAGQRELRGADMRAARRLAIDNCRDGAIPVNLAVTVDRHNIGHLGEMLRFAINTPIVRGVCWQPMFGSGRVYSGVNLDGSSTPSASGQKPAVRRPPTERLSVADIIQAVVRQSGGVVAESDFTPLPCGDPNCHTVAYLLRRDEGVMGISRWVDLQSMQTFLKDRLDYNVEDLHRCGCDSEPLGRLLKQLEIGPESVLRLVIKPFMDAWTYDQHRVDRCCVHVVGPDGALDSFCHHYAMRSAPR